MLRVFLKIQFNLIKRLNFHLLKTRQIPNLICFLVKIMNNKVLIKDYKLQNNY